jgi:imidazolonepropionase-like amidohydrolase
MTMELLAVAAAMGQGPDFFQDPLGGPPASVQAPTGQPANVPFEREADRKPKTVTHGSVLIRHGKVLTVTQGTLEDTDVLILNGKIAKIGKGLSATGGVTTIDATGKIVAPGIVDAHSHRGATSINEGTDSVTAEVQMRDVLDPQSEGVWFDLANGITSALLLHGSANAIGGQSIVVKHRYKATPSQMVFEGAPRMVKFALGENVTQKNGSNATRYPESRMGVESVYRRAFADAQQYMARWDAYNASVAKVGSAETLRTMGPAPRKDVRLEALADILRRKIWVNCHSYRQDEMLMMVRLSQEFGFKLGAMQHALEAYKIAPEIAKAGVPVSMFSDAWNYKLEVIDSIPMGAALCVRAGILTSVNTDTSGGTATLNLDAGKLMRYGVSEDDALETITINSAKQLGVDSHVGSLEVGKDGDVGIWSGHPLSVYSKCMQTFIDGECVFERRDAIGVDKASTSKDTVSPDPLRADLLKDLPAADSYAIVGAMVHPVSGPEIPKGVVVIEGSSITAVGDMHTPIPKGAVRVNAQGLHVYPGLIDAGSDLGLTEVGSVRQATDETELGAINPDLHALIAVNPETMKIPIARAAGITTATVWPNGGVLPGQTAVIDLGGYTREEMSLNSSFLVVNWPEPPNRRFAAFLGAAGADNSSPQVEALKERFLAAKRAAEARDLSDPKMAALAPYARGEKPVLFKVEGLRGIRAVLAFAKELKLKAVIGGGADAWKIASEVAAAKVPVIYSPPSVSGPGEATPHNGYDPYDTPFAAVSALVKAGVKVAFSTGDSGLIQDLPNRVGHLCAFGLAPEAALRALTLDAAEILGVKARVGSLEAGKLANLIVTNGDPMELTGQVLREFVAGKPQKLQSHFTTLYRKYETRINDTLGKSK